MCYKHVAGCLWHEFNRKPCSKVMSSDNVFVAGNSSEYNNIGKFSLWYTCRYPNLYSSTCLGSTCVIYIVVPVYVLLEVYRYVEFSQQHQLVMRYCKSQPSKWLEVNGMITGILFTPFVQAEITVIWFNFILFLISYTTVCTKT